MRILTCFMFGSNVRNNCDAVYAARDVRQRFIITSRGCEIHSTGWCKKTEPVINSYCKPDISQGKVAAHCTHNNNRARQLYKNISMLFLFPVKDGKLSTQCNI